MKIDSNIEAIQLRLALFKANVAAGSFSDALVGGLVAGMGLMKRRIFNQSMDADGISLGNYISKEYRRLRLKNGRQIAKKDLEFAGALRRAIEVVSINNTRAQIRINNSELAQIAVYLEQQIANIRSGRPANSPTSQRARIFTLSDTEIAILRKNTLELLRQKIVFE